MEKETPISMKNLGVNTKMSKIKTITFTVIITFLVIMTVEYLTTKFTEPEPSEKSKTISLQQVIIAYAPETKSIVFLDRKTGNVEFALSDSVSLAIFALKSGEIVADYTSKVTIPPKTTK